MCWPETRGAWFSRHSAVISAILLIWPVRADRWISGVFRVPRCAQGARGGRCAAGRSGAKVLTVFFGELRKKMFRRCRRKVGACGLGAFGIVGGDVKRGLKGEVGALAVK